MQGVPTAKAAQPTIALSFLLHRQTARPRSIRPGNIDRIFGLCRRIICQIGPGTFGKQRRDERPIRRPASIDYNDSRSPDWNLAGCGFCLSQNLVGILCGHFIAKDAAKYALPRDTKKGLANAIRETAAGRVRPVPLRSMLARKDDRFLGRWYGVKEGTP
jgi:hypothetical protein